MTVGYITVGRMRVGLTIMPHLTVGLMVVGQMAVSQRIFGQMAVRQLSVSLNGCQPINCRKTVVQLTVNKLTVGQTTW